MAPLSFAAARLAGTSVFTLDSTDIMASVGESFSAVLAARVPGLSVIRPGGSSAEGSRVRLRGPRSFFMTTEPIVIVDGIRVDAMQEASVIDVGVRVSRLDDIVPEDVARIDVLPGPAAASLFGPGASGGALVITTKRGDAGSLRWTGRAESRVGLKPSGFPANYRMNGISTATGQPAASCDVLEVASGVCTPTGLDVWNPLEQASPFRAARTTAGHLSLAGGFGETSARISAAGHHTLGIAAGDDQGRLGLGANVAHQVLDRVDLGVHGRYTRTSAGLPLRGNRGSVLTSGLFGSATDDATRGYRVFGSEAIDVRQRATHWHAGASARWRPRSWLAVSALYGRDQLDQRDDLLSTVTRTNGGTSTFTERGDATHAMTTAGASVAASYALAHSLSIGGTTSAGYERLGSALGVGDRASSFDNGLPVAGSSRMISNRWVIDGPWLRQQLTWGDRVSVAGALRLERRGAFGTEMPSMWFKSADASWWLGGIGLAEELRLRAAYGEASNWMAGDLGLLAASIVFDVPDASAFEPAERVAESEVGLDARLGNLTRVAITAFRADASKLYVFSALPPSTGFGGQTVLPVGSMRNEGLEATVGTRLLDRPGLRWDVTLTAATLRNRVRSLGSASPQIGSDTRTAPGYPLGGYWSRPYTYADANGNGVIEPSEIQYGDTAVFAGPSLPTREVSLHSALALPGRLTASVLFDHRGGHKLANANERIRCRSYRNCRAAQDPTAPPAEQARYAVSRGGVTTDLFVQDASFVKLRELSLTWTIPASWVDRVADRTAALTLAGRNVATWTRYDGLDPELDYRRFNQLPGAELGKSPPLRELVLRLDVGAGGGR